MEHHVFGRLLAMPTPSFSNDELIEALSQTIPSAALEAALDKTGKREQRVRRLPAALILQLVIALGLLVDMARRQVLATLRPPTPARPLPSKVAICRACRRVGARPMIELFHAVARPLADPAATPQAFYRDHRLVSLDGGGLDLPDSPANERAFGRAASSRGQTAFPQAKALWLVETGTRAVLDLELRPARRGEQPPARRIITRRLAPDMLVLLDRGLYSYKTMAAIAARGAHFLGRIPATVVLEPTPAGALKDGSYLCRIQPDHASRRAGAQPLRVRVIEYRISGHDELYRLATSLLDEEAYPAVELAGLYHERWEAETFLDEIKTHQQGRPNGQRVAIHAQTPAGVVQEIYGLALAHRVIHTLMLGAAAARGIDPDRISFKNALVIVRRYLPQLAQARKKERPPLLPKCSSRSATNACPNVSGDAISAG
jgi:hypothetical protein